MTTKLIQIGNSKGIRLSKSLIEQYEFSEEVELVPEKNGILIAPKKQPPRADWDKILAGQATELAKEDTQWLNAPLTTPDDWTW
jgi:antitoxin MazE